MKVYMGKYKNYLGPYQLAQKICFWAKNDLEYGYPKYVDRLGQFFAHGRFVSDDEVTWNVPINREDVGKLSQPVAEYSRLHKFLNWVNEKRGVQNVYVKIDDYDVWSMSHTLAHIITPMLKKLKETQHGAPYTDDADVPEHLRSTAAPPKENDWDTDENHFKRWEWILDEMIWSFEYCLQEDDLILKLSDEDLTANDVRRKNGYRLFGKYYDNLWD